MPSYTHTDEEALWAELGLTASWTGLETVEVSWTGLAIGHWPVPELTEKAVLPDWGGVTHSTCRSP